MDGANRLVLTSCPETQLVAGEALAALNNSGWLTATWSEADLVPQRLARLFALPPERSGLAAYPSLFFSVNFRGLDKYGEAFAVLQAKGIPLAVWCVDNPWNLLSGLRSDFWKYVHLFVTDPSHIPALYAHGATSVMFLPLATSPAIFCSRKTNTIATSPVVFVGRSAFPDKDRFFVGQSVSDTSLEKASAFMDAGERPDFAWWLRELHMETAETVLWPGSAARKASLGAENASLAWRTACLLEAARSGLAIYGDAAWKEIFSQLAEHAPIFPGPVDYYRDLPGLYATASYSLNVMSFLLPHGLNQRHFDIWAAGGFCIMDKCPGLDLFPSELTEPIAFAQPGDISAIIERFSTAPEEKAALRFAWQRHTLTEHTYERRMHTLTKSILS